MERGVKSPHRRSDAQDDLEGVSHGFLGERESEEQVAIVLIIRERRHKMTWAVQVPRKGIALDCKESSEVHRPAGAQQRY